MTLPGLIGGSLVVAVVVSPIAPLRRLAFSVFWLFVAAQAFMIVYG